MSNAPGTGWTRRRARTLPILLLASCTSVPSIPVEAVLGFEPLRTTVDSELAARYLRGDDDPRIAALEAEFDARPLTTAALEALSAESSTDLATAYFVRRTLRDPRHGAAQRRFDETLARLRGMPQPRIEGVDPGRYTLLFVPGMYYKSHPETGAAMEGPRRVLGAAGFETRFVPVDEVGTVEANARVVAEHLARLRGTDRRVVILSGSKGSADVAEALGRLLAGADLRQVAGWLSVGGILHGSPRADFALQWPRRWFVGATGWLTGATLALARDLATETSARRAAAQTFPAHLRILHYVSTPFSGTVTGPARGGYERIRPLGPNDGVTLLPDQILPEGSAVLAVGLDHYFRAPDADLRVMALTSVLLERVEEQPAEDGRPRR